MKKILSFLSIVMILFACEDFKEIKYTQVINYFVFNSATDVPALIKTEEMFDSCFGAAAFMGKNGMPTPIDFSKEVVIAVVLPETFCPTTITPVRLTQKDKKLIFYYSVKEDFPTSYTTRPFLLIKTSAKKAEKVRLVREKNVENE